MPVAGGGQPGNMGQDSKAQKSSSGLITRVRKSIKVKSRRRSYSLHESLQTYADIDQKMEEDTIAVPLPNDYDQVDQRDLTDRCKDQLESNGDKTMNGRSAKPEEDGNVQHQPPVKVNGVFPKVTNGFHDMEASSDEDDIDNLKRRNSGTHRVENDYIRNNEATDQSSAEPQTYCVPGRSNVDDLGCENHHFERQGAKPKQHYNKNKNGLREAESSAAVATKRQAAKLAQSKSVSPSQQNYFNVDLAEMSVQESMDDEIREALKGPVLPPLMLPADSHSHVPSAPKTPHIEHVFRKDEMDEEELEEMKFATRAMGLKLDPEVMGHHSTISNKIQLPDAPNQVPKADRGMDPSSAGLLLMSERDVSLHQDGESMVDGMLASNTFDESPHRDIQLRPTNPDAPPVVDRTSKPVFSPEEEDVFSQASLSSELPPPVPPRLPTREDDGEPTHEAIPHLRVPPRQIRSLSLPRNISPGFLEQQEQEQNSTKVNRRKVMSILFQKRSKRNSTFSERPLPAIPPLQPGKFPVNIPRDRAATMATDRRLPELPGEGSLEDQYPLDPDEEQPPPPPPKIPIKSARELQKELEVKQILKARGEFASSLRKISDFGWYWGPMSWDDAETRLENTPDGSFLVRDSSDERHILSLSFRANGTTHHTRIEHQHGKFSFWSQPTSHGSTSVVDFIEEAMKHSHNGSFLYFLRPRMPGLPPAPVQLLYAISRFQKVRSLQHMCRFVIRKNIRLDHIEQLPLPKRLKDYLAGAHYYTPEALEP